MKTPNFRLLTLSTISIAILLFSVTHARVDIVEIKSSRNICDTYTDEKDPYQWTLQYAIKKLNENFAKNQMPEVEVLECEKYKNGHLRPDVYFVKLNFTDKEPCEKNDFRVLDKDFDFDKISPEFKEEFTGFRMNAAVIYESLSSAGIRVNFHTHYNAPMTATFMISSCMVE